MSGSGATITAVVDRPGRSRHPLGEPGPMKQPGRLAVRADRSLAGDRGEEPAIESATREVTHDPWPDCVDERVALAADVERGRPIEQNCLNPVVERHRRLHVED